MKADLSARTEWLIAAGSIIAACLVAASSTVHIRKNSRIIEDYMDNFRQLKDLQAMHQRQEAAVRAYEQLGNVSAVPLSELFEKNIPGTKYETSEIPSRAVLPGWALRRNSVSFPRCNLKDLGIFLSAAESQRPPWRVTECTITALTPDGSAGHARVFLETIEKKD